VNCEITESIEKNQNKTQLLALSNKKIIKSSKTLSHRDLPYAIFENGNTSNTTT